MLAAINELRDKVKAVWHAHMSENHRPRTLYHMAIFFFSVRGQKRIWGFAWRTVRWVVLWITGGQPIDLLDYNLWAKKNFPKPKDFVRFRAQQALFSYKPTISILVPVYNPKLEHLEECIDSVSKQLYPNWQLCIADDASSDPAVREYLESLQDPKIHVIFREENGHIATCSNSALSEAKGEFVALLDQDDLLTRDALFHVVALLNERSEADLIYTDEDKITDEGELILPHFKPQWSPESFLTRNYIGHLAVIRKELLDRVGGFHEGLDGAQDYDLLLRVTEQTDRIERIPRVLYHWRLHGESTSMNKEAKTYAFDNGAEALNRALKRRGLAGRAEVQEGLPGAYIMRFDLLDTPKVTIVIPSKDKADVLEVCLKSIFKLTTYPNYEVLLLSNNSSEPSFFELVKHWEEQEPERFRCTLCDYPFNHSRLMNDGVGKTDASYILLLNNDTEVIREDWIERMLEYAQQPKVGAVGAKLLYHNDTIQHAGVVMGLGAVAGHTFTGVDKSSAGYFSLLRSVSNYSAVTAACLLVDAAKYKEIGGFDEKLEVEYNDVDFCLRLGAAGYRNVVVQDVELYHYESLTRGHPHSNPESYRRHLREVRYIKEKWGHLIEDDPYYSPNLSRTHTTYLARFS